MSKPATGGTPAPLRCVGISAAERDHRRAPPLTASRAARAAPRAAPPRGSPPPARGRRSSGRAGGGTSRIDSARPPVSRPNTVPRSRTRFELHVAAAADSPATVARPRPRAGPGAARRWADRRRERARDVLRERGIARERPALVLEEDPAHPAVLAAVAKVEVGVRRALEARMAPWLVALARLAQHAVEVNAVLLEQVMRREVRTTAEPGGVAAPDHPHVHVRGRDHWARGVDDDREAGRGELGALAAQLAGELRRERPVDLREAHARLLEHGAVLQHAGDPASTAGPFPGVRAEPRAAVDALQLAAERVLRRPRERDHLGVEPVERFGRARGRHGGRDGVPGREVPPPGGAVEPRLLAPANGARRQGPVRRLPPCRFP